MDRLRLAYFTPLSPLRTALADHSEGLLPLIAQDADVDLFIDEGYSPVNPRIVERLNIYSYREFPQRAADYDLPVYVMGDDLTYHGYMHDLMRDYPGVVILHDTEFQHYFIQRTYARGDVAAYRAELEYAYGPLADSIMAVVQAGEIERLRGLFPLVERIVDWSRGAIVYNDFAREDLTRRRPEAKVRALKHHFYLPDGFPAEVDVASLRKRWQLEGNFIIGTFGLFIPDKRIDVCLRAFKRFLAIRPDARYILVGQHSPYYDVPGMIRRYGLDGHVILTGWMDALEFAQHLCLPDIVIHLRYPHIGGTSYTPIRLLGLGRPTILSDIETLMEFPEGCCVKIAPDEYEEETLFAVLCYLAEHDEIRQQMGENARHFIQEHHDVGRIARQHVEFFAEVAASPPKTPPSPPYHFWDDQLVQEIAAILARWGVSERDDDLLRPIAAAIAELTRPLAPLGFV